MMDGLQYAINPRLTLERAVDGQWAVEAVEANGRTHHTIMHPEDVLELVMRLLESHAPPPPDDEHRGGVVLSGEPDSDLVPAILSQGHHITDPDEAEALGLTVDARRMREAHVGLRAHFPKAHFGACPPDCKSWQRGLH